MKKWILADIADAINNAIDNVLDSIIIWLRRIYHVAESKMRRL